MQISLLANFINNFKLLKILKYPIRRIFFLASINSFVEVSVLALFGIFITNVLQNSISVKIIYFEFNMNDFMLLLLILIITKLFITIFYLNYLRLTNKRSLQNYLNLIKNNSYNSKFLINQNEHIELRLTTTDIHHLLPSIIMPLTNFIADCLTILLILLVIIFKYKLTAVYGLALFFSSCFIFFLIIKKSNPKKNISDLSNKLLSLYNIYFKNKFFILSLSSRKKFSKFISSIEVYLINILVNLTFKKSLFKPSIEFVIILSGLSIVFFDLSSYFIILIFLIRSVPSLLNIGNMIMTHSVYSKISQDFMQIVQNKNYNFSESSINKVNLQPNNSDFKITKITGINNFTNQKIELILGKLNFITGISGSGKSTLLNELSGLIPASFWSLNFFENEKLISQKENEISNNVIYLPQDLHDNKLVLSEFLNNLSISLDSVDKHLTTLITYFKNDFYNRSFNTFSGGEKQRIYISIALAKKKKIILFDEPSSGLDKKSSHEIIELLNEIKDLSLVIVVTHDVNLIENSNNILEIIKSR